MAVPPAEATGLQVRPSRSPVPKVDEVVFGGDYNPEQWPRAVWDEDVALMRSAGVNLVSIGVFSWSLIEPREGEFDFAWLDDLMDLLATNGIRANLGTPTASPPAWFWKKYPLARPMNREGVPLGFGSRGMVSPSSPEYAEACARVTSALARRYANHPALALWHVHNEYGIPVSECFSQYSVNAFRAWLVGRYHTLDALNHAWGTVFWGQRYGEWDEVDAPRLAASVVNPAQRLDFKRFTSDALLTCFKRERDILHELSPGTPVTTNFMATNCEEVDYWKWADEVDVVANDHYLKAERLDNHIQLAMDADIVRSLARGKPWLLMEHSTSAVNWQPRNIAKRVGELSRNSFAHFARGADGIMFFQWRASHYGAEKFHSAMIPHGGTDSRTWRETHELGEGLAGLGEILGSTVKARVAILWDWESFWAQDLEWRPSVDLSHRAQIEAYYTRLWEYGVTTDFAHPEADLSGYDLVIAPSLYLVSTLASENIDRFVRGGGQLVVSYFSGIVDVNDTVYPGAMPGALRDVLGVEVSEFLPLRAGEVVTVSSGHSATVWAERLRSLGAEVIATYSSGPAEAEPAITLNRHGSGAALYVSTQLRDRALDSVLLPALERAGLAVTPPPPGIERVVREGSDGVRFTFFINHTDVTATVDVKGHELTVGTALESELTVPAGAVRIVRSRP